MRINEIDPETLQPFEAFTCARVCGPGSADFRVIDWNSGEKNTRAVQIKIAAIDPELAKTEAHRLRMIERLAVFVEQLQREFVLICRRVNVPEPLSVEFVCERELAFRQSFGP